MGAMSLMYAEFLKLFVPPGCDNSGATVIPRMKAKKMGKTMPFSG
jgi:hypothetical protein